MLRDAPNINYLFAGLLIEELVRHGVEWFVISPGSRSAPLAWTAASHPRAKTVVHFDERGAAFHALGIAKATLKPAAFICTSGTAAANALPAAVEASYSGIPLILLTADRPERLQGSGANQTINQHGLYREFVRDEKNFAVSAEEFDAAATLTAIDEALYRAKASWPGPAHLNCQIDEPLAPEVMTAVAFTPEALLEPVSQWTVSGKIFSPRPHEKAFPESSLAQLREIVSRPVPGLVIVGQLSGPNERDRVKEILTCLQWPYIPDITSGLRLDLKSLWDANHRAAEIFSHAQVLVHLGGPVTSRRLLDEMAHFATSDGKREFVRICASREELDPYGNVTLRLVAPPQILENVLSSSTGRAADQWPASILSCGRKVYEKILQTCSDDDAPNEISAVTSLTSDPARWALFAGNSMPIRALDLYGLSNADDPSTWVIANRGASGIDGNVATAAGHARATGEPVVALLGDLALLHDLNSLALLRELAAPVVLVVINNNGGGIFNLLPIAQHIEHFEKLFGTPHGLGFADAAQMFGIDYLRATSNLALLDRTNDAMNCGRSCVVEIVTSREENVRQHRTLDAAIRAALASPTSPPS